jgi:hypothetical protein
MSASPCYVVHYKTVFYQPFCNKEIMKRDYASGEHNDIIFFTGVEIEKTPAYGKFTLFVTGVHTPEEVHWAFDNHPDGIEHIFFGANHSFNPDGYDEWKAWENMIEHFLKLGVWCSLDIPLNAVEEFNEGGLNDYNNFIPQIRVPIPYIKLWNYNTMIKIDDKNFNATNPGVWTHSLHKLKNRESFTSWDQYKNDKVIK